MKKRVVITVLLAVLGHRVAIAEMSESESDQMQKSVDQVMSVNQTLSGKNCPPSSNPQAAQCRKINSDIRNLCSYPNGYDDLSRRLKASPSLVNDPKELSKIMGEIDFQSKINQSAKPKTINVLKQPSFLSEAGARILLNQYELGKSGYSEENSASALKANCIPSRDGGCYPSTLNTSLMREINEYYSNLSTSVVKDLHSKYPSKTIAYSEIFPNIRDAVDHYRESGSTVNYEDVFSKLNELGNGTCAAPYVYTKDSSVDLVYEHKEAKDLESKYAQEWKLSFDDQNAKRRNDVTSYRFCDREPTNKDIAISRLDFDAHDVDVPESKKCTLNFVKNYRSNSAELSPIALDELNSMIAKECPQFAGMTPSSIHVASSSSGEPNGAPYCERDFRGLSRDRGQALKANLKSYFSNIPITVDPTGENGDGTSGACPFYMEEISDPKYSAMDESQFPINEGGSSMGPFIYKDSRGQLYREKAYTYKNSKGELFTSSASGRSKFDPKTDLADARYAKATLVFDSGPKDAPRSVASKTSMGDYLGRGDRFRCHELIIGCKMH